MWHICGTGEVHIEFMYGSLMEKKRRLEKSRHGLEGNIEMHLTRRLMECVSWIYPVYERKNWWGVVNMAMQFTSHKMPCIS
jgi:hypothetical protein